MTALELPQKLRELGAEITSSLDKTQDKPTSVFWYYSDNNEWILHIASSASKTDNSSDQNKIADRVQERISEITLENVPFAIMEPQNYLILAMSNFFVTEPDLIGQIEFKNNIINDQLIRSVYAYRLTT
jgi:hypothetical protein